MKTCSKCKELKDDNQFTFRNKSKGIKNGHCIVCQAIARKRSYDKNQQHYLDYARTNVPKIRKVRSDFIVQLKTNKICTDCQKPFPHYVLDFDHLPQFKKEIKIGSRGRRYSKETLLKEVAKCELVCANCHRERTWQRKMAATVGLPPTPVV